MRVVQHPGRFRLRRTPKMGQFSSYAFIDCIGNISWPADNEREHSTIDNRRRSSVSIPKSKNLAMGQAVNIIMYHYVRELSRSRYPEIKALLVDEFRKHLDFFTKTGVVLTGQDIVAAQQGNFDLPENAFWLTFDDGYSDHYNYVFPLLHEFGVSGTFFPPTKCMNNHILLDVNAIHFILACTKHPLDVIERLKSIANNRVNYNDLKGFDTYWTENAVANRFDTAEVIFVKRMLQHALPANHRRAIIDQLFAEFVSVDQSAFAEELYLRPEQVRVMNDAGMEFGSHTHSHPWMDRISIEEQRSEIQDSVGYLKEMGVPMHNWIMCFPYGASDQKSQSLMTELGASIGVGTEVRMANLERDHPMNLPRWDANDVLTHLPKSRLEE